MTTYPVTAMPIKYTVSCLPFDHPERRHFELYVEWRGNDQWAVTNGFSYCLSTNGKWGYEMMSSERTEHWIRTHRFDLETALKLAAELAPTMTIGPVGHEYTVAKAMAEYKASQE